MRKVLLLVMGVMILGTSLFAKEKSELNKTKIEKFIARKGAVIIKGYKNIGTIECSYGGSLEVTLKEFTNATSKRKIYGIAISVNNGKKYNNENISYIDYSEIDSLIKGIEYIVKIDKTVTKLGNFEATYSTDGELSITTFNDNYSGGITSAISSGRIGRVSVYCSLPKLTMIKALLQKTYKEIKLLKK